jgi:hypothetical protein
MKNEARLRAPNSLLLVTTSDVPDIPGDIGPQLTSRTATCIAIGTVAEDDDEVTVSLTNEHVADLALSLACDAVMDASVGHIAVETVLGDKLLVLPVSANPLQVRVWVSSLSEPDRILVEALGGG